MYGSQAVEGIVEAARRCAMDDLGVRIKRWPRRLTLSYSARDPRDPRYCENELLHVMAARHEGPFRMNKKNAYELHWAKFEEIAKDSTADLEKKPIDRRYAPWVHSLFSPLYDEVEATLLVK
jgi:isopentenyldiphosphate isomerase